MIDTLKTTGAGMGGFFISLWGWLPEAVSLSVGIATLIYLVIKIIKELRTKQGE
jgi:high-affinity Fe2+/Pb2+ permease